MTIESLESRLLLYAILRPDVTWQNDGSMPRERSGPLVAVVGNRFVSHLKTSETSSKLIKYLADGSADPSFQVSSIDIDSAQTKADASGRFIGVMSNHKTNTIRLVRFLANGAIDSSFGSNGIAIVLPPAPKKGSVFGFEIFSIDVSPDGTIYLASNLLIRRLVFNTQTHQNEPQIQSYFLVQKLTGKGNVDNHFAGAGALAIAGAPSTYGPINWFGSDSTGGLFAVINGGERIYHYRSNGTRYKKYAPQPASLNFQPILSTFDHLAVDRQDRLLVSRLNIVDHEFDAGSDYFPSLERISSNGMMDYSFSSRLEPPNFTDVGSVSAPVVLPDGKILISVGNHLMRLNANGEPDQSFGPAGSQDMVPFLSIIMPMEDGTIMGGYPVMRITPAPAIALSASGTLHLLGTDSDDQARIRYDPYAQDDNIHVYVNGKKKNFWHQRVHKIDVQLFGGNNQFVNYSGIEAGITTGDGNDSISTSGGVDTIMAGDGDNRISSGTGLDYVNIGNGNNTIYDSGDGAFVFEIHDDNGRSTNHITGKSGSWDIDLSHSGPAIIDLSDIQRLSVHTGDFKDRIQAYSYYPGYPGFVNSGAGDDWIDLQNFTVSDASDGNQQVFSGDGNDTIYTGNGNDNIDGEAGDDVISDSSGTNTIRGGLGQDRIFGGHGDDIIIDVSGNNQIVDYQGRNSIRVGIGNDSIYSRPVPANADYEPVKDTIRGGGGRDTLYGDNIDQSTEIEVYG